MKIIKKIGELIGKIVKKEKQEIIKISFENWLAAWKKWCNIIIKVAKYERFKQGRSGFLNLGVIEECGYCLGIKPGRNGCNACSLHQKKICNSGKNNYENYPFWVFVDEMQKPEPNFKKALKYAKKVLKGIEEDGREWGYWEKMWEVIDEDLESIHNTLVFLDEEFRKFKDEILKPQEPEVKEAAII